MRHDGRTERQGRPGQTGERGRAMNGSVYEKFTIAGTDYTVLEVSGHPEEGYTISFKNKNGETFFLNESGQVSGFWLFETAGGCRLALLFYLEGLTY